METLGNVELGDKLKALATAARYDASCASSGTDRGPAGSGVGMTVPSGICHSFTEDGRCVSLLKVLFTNFCIYDCSYCVNRSSNDIPRTRFTTQELVDLTLSFYRRNYIEGLFLSSGILRGPDYTMERLVHVARTLRLQYGYNGYIHLKCIPGAGDHLVREAGLYADRLSVNIELPTEASLKRLARDKDYPSILGPMESIQDSIRASRDERRAIRSAPGYAPAGQSTQLIVGASPERDYEILRLARDLYRSRDLRRVYYSAYVPVNTTDSRLSTLSEPPLRRENRLYQSDWLLRLYGFELDEILTPDRPDLDLSIDPKHAYALRHPELFPVDLNRADYEQILRVPGIGLQSASRIVALRRERAIRFEHLAKIGIVVRRAAPFIHCPGIKVRSKVEREGLSEEIQPHGVASGKGLPVSCHTRLRTVLIHDGSFEGLLTAIFETYERKAAPDAIGRKGAYQGGLFDRCLIVTTDLAKSDRVWRRLFDLLGHRYARILFCAFLSGEDGVDLTICQAVRDAVDRERTGREGKLRERLSELEATGRKVRREAHRMRGFVRFERLVGDLYVALIAPKHNVLPLILDHFERRCHDQEWLIHDTVRHYGYYFDGRGASEVRLPQDRIARIEQGGGSLEDYRELWKQYYDSVNIPERRNLPLHLLKVPRRYWRYLPEKRGVMG